MTSGVGDGVGAVGCVAGVGAVGCVAGVGAVGCVVTARLAVGTGAGFGAGAPDAGLGIGAEGGFGLELGRNAMHAMPNVTTPNDAKRRNMAGSLAQFSRASSRMPLSLATTTTSVR